MGHIIFRKRQGNTTMTMLSSFLLLMIITLMVYGVSMRRAKSIKYQADDKIIFSCLGCELSDTEYYMETGEMVLETGAGYSYMNNPVSATSSAWQIARAYFEELLADNMKLNSNLTPGADTSPAITSVLVKKFVVYNVFQDKIMECSYPGNVTTYNITETVISPPSVNTTGYTVKDTGVYVDVTVKIKTFLGQENDIVIREFVGLTSP